MKTKTASIFLFFCVMTISSCNPGVVTEAGPQQVSEQPDASDMSPDPVLTEPPFVPSPAKVLSAEFDLSNVNTVRPEEVLEEVGYFGQGAGVCGETSGSGPEITTFPEDQELMIQTSMIACGWQENEILTATVQYPDGKIEQWSLQADEDMSGVYYGRLDFQPTITDSTGTYVLNLEGSSGTVNTEVHFSMPEGPRLFAVSSNQLFLYGFAPGESIALYCYDLNAPGEFLGWEEYRVDENGQLTINAPVENCNFAAVGSLSGEVHLLRYMSRGESYDPSRYGIQKAFCGGLLSRLIGGRDARVAFTNGFDKRVRTKPGFSADILATVPEGTTVYIFEHECADNSVWWHVYAGGQEGWMTEEQDGVYLLEPYP